MERTAAWTVQPRGLDRRWDRAAKTTTALLTLAAAYTAMRFLIKARQQLWNHFLRRSSDPVPRCYGDISRLLADEDVM